MIHHAPLVDDRQNETFLDLVRNIESQTIVLVSSMKFARDTISLHIETIETFVSYNPIFFVELPDAITFNIGSDRVPILCQIIIDSASYIKYNLNSVTLLIFHHYFIFMKTLDIFITNS